MHYIVVFIASAIQSNSPPEMRPRGDTEVYIGVISKLGPNWLELKAGYEWSVRRDAQGRDISALYDNTKPLRLSARGTSVVGNTQGDGDIATYRITDLRIGDRVHVCTAFDETRADEWTICVEIHRRPTGRIPAMRGREYWHRARQAEQDWEEKGVPIPAVYLSDGRNNTNPPYPPVAPYPRAKPHLAPASRAR